MNITRIMRNLSLATVAATGITTVGVTTGCNPNPAYDPIILERLEDTRNQYIKDSLEYVKYSPDSADIRLKLDKMMQARSEYIKRHYPDAPDISSMTKWQCIEAIDRGIPCKSDTTAEVARMIEYEMNWKKRYYILTHGFSKENYHLQLYLYAFKHDKFITEISKIIFENQQKLSKANVENLERSRNLYNSLVENHIKDIIAADDEIKHLKKNLSYLRDKLSMINVDIVCTDSVSEQQQLKIDELTKDISELESKIKALSKSKKDAQQKIYKEELQSEIKAAQRKPAYKNYDL